MYVLHYIVQSISGVSLATALTSAFQETSIAIVALVVGISSDNVKILSVTLGAASARRRNLLQSDSVLMEYTMSMTNGNADNMEASLTSAITSGSFTQALQSTGYSTATAKAVPLVMNLSPTAKPSSAPTLNPTSISKSNRVSKHTLVIVGSVTASVICLIAIIYGLLLFKRHRKKTRVAVYEQEDDTDLECQAHMTRRIISAENSGKADCLLLREWSENFDQTEAYLDSRQVSPAKLKMDHKFGKKVNARKVTMRGISYDEES